MDNTHISIRLIRERCIDPRVSGRSKAAKLTPVSLVNPQVPEAGYQAKCRVMDDPDHPLRVDGCREVLGWSSGLGCPLRDGPRRVSLLACPDYVESSNSKDNLALRQPCYTCARITPSGCLTARDTNKIQWEQAAIWTEAHAAGKGMSPSE